MLSLGLGTWWAAIKLAGGDPDPRGRDVIRRAMLLFTAAILVSYLVAATRPVSAAELRQADTGLVLALGWLGLLLFTSSGLNSMAALTTTLRRLVLAGGLLASLGILQFVTKRAFTNYIQIPGLATNNTLVSVVGRGGLTRPAGTALHPIEFGAVLTMMLPDRIALRNAGSHQECYKALVPGRSHRDCGADIDFPLGNCQHRGGAGRPAAELDPNRPPGRLRSA